jgi:hypothetical protein
VLLALIIAAISGATYLATPWREQNFGPPLVGMAWLTANGVKLLSSIAFWVSLAGAVGLWLDEQVRG